MAIYSDKMQVRINFLEDVLGSAPADPNIFTRFVSSKAEYEWQKTEEENTIPERTEDTGVTVFNQDKKGLFLFNYHIKGFIKEAGNNLKDVDNIKIKNLRNKIDKYVFVFPRRIYFTRNGQVITEEDGVIERSLRGMTARGERISLIRSDVIRLPVEIEFNIEVLQNKEVTLDIVRELLGYGRYKGLGQWRNGGFGQFEWKELAKEQGKRAG